MTDYSGNVSWIEGKQVFSTGLTVVRRSLILSTLIALVSAPSAAGPPSDKIAQRFAEPYTGYNRDCGYPIIFARIATVSEARIDRRLGPVILLDPFLNYPGQARHRKFLIAHECAHHKLSHTTKKGLHDRFNRSKGVEDQELSADCRASEALVSAGLFADAVFVADLLYRKGLHSPGSGYPSGVQRSTLIYHCIQMARRKQRDKEVATPKN